jgi:hypothetical protein
MADATGTPTDAGVGASPGLGMYLKESRATVRPTSLPTALTSGGETTSLTPDTRG